MMWMIPGLRCRRQMADGGGGAGAFIREQYGDQWVIVGRTSKRSAPGGKRFRKCFISGSNPSY